MKILEKLFDIFAPNSCLSCGQESRLICAWCWPHAFDALPSRCYRCYKSTSEAAVCDKCRKATPVMRAWVTTAYNKLPRELIKGMKYQQQRQAVYLLAQKFNEALPHFEEITITYVPTASSRHRQRGFDHSKIIARELASLRGLDYAPLLIRTNQLRQVGSTRKDRLAQAKGAFRVINTRHLLRKRILLVDDVLTTGATIEEAARTLKRAGAKKVDAAIFAQATQ